jgi:glutamate dehydrogenase
MKEMRIRTESSSIVAAAQKGGLETSVLYESVIELANEGLLTAGCLNAAAGVLLTQLGLPQYFFRNVGKDSLKRILRTIATHMQYRDGAFVLRSEVSGASMAVADGVQARLATAENRDQMEAVLNSVMTGHRIEYYFGREKEYYTYIIRPELCKRWEELQAGESPFAFNQCPAGQEIPSSTRERYEGFLRRSKAAVLPLVEVSSAAPSDETRVMFIDDFDRSALPVIRRMLSELGIVLNRAYWETYRTATGRIESVCSLYLDGAPRKAALDKAVERLRALLSVQTSDLDDLYVGGAFTFPEYIFAISACAFVHTFISKDQPADRGIMDGLARKELRDAFAKRVFDSNRAEYTRQGILDTLRQRPEFLKQLHKLFERKFHPRNRGKADLKALDRELQAFRQRVAITFVDDRTGCDVYHFMTRLVTHTHKTNFYRVGKRSCAFRLDPALLDPLVFPGKVHGIFFVVGFYAVATHMRAEEIARGGMRLIRVTPGNYENELDSMPLLNYALGPVAQRLKHKDIAESGSKAVIVPGVEYARDGLSAVFDLTEGVMDLMQGGEDIVDYLGRPEMIFFGPDEGTAGFMDAVAERARARGYKHWRTITTGKSIGIPHDVYGLTRDRHVFGLVAQPQGTELEIDGVPQFVTKDMERIHARIGDRIDTSGMTTMSVLSALRVLLDHLGLKEEEVNLMMTGGPDGDLGANQVQSFKGRICLIIDSGSILFDPDGLDRTELMKIAFARHTAPRLNSLAYPAEKLGKRGFRVPRAPGQVKLPDGSVVPDGAFFHRRFLVNPEARKFVAEANIRAFVPCGGFKDTINAENVRAFVALFKELKVIVEGANVFFDDTAREVIAAETSVLQVRDSSANKGGVTSSSIAEVLTAFLLGEEYEKVLVRNPKARSEMITAVFDLIAQNAAAEARMLLALHARTKTPLYRLSVQTSEQLFALQERLCADMEGLLKRRDVVEAVLRAYIPGALIERVGMARVLRTFETPELRPYRDAMITKKLAALAIYRHAQEWEAYAKRLDADLLGTVAETAMGARGK